MAKSNKRYYWIQLNQDFFTSKEMKLLRKIAGGDTHTIIYLKMMLASLENEGRIFYDGLADNLAEEIALMIDESVDDIKITLLFLESKGLLTKSSDREYILEQVPEMVGSETASARRVRKHREGQRLLQSNNDVTKCNGEIEKDKELEQDIELESEIDLSSSCVNNKKDITLKDLISDFEKGFGRLLSPFEIESIQKTVDEDKTNPVIVREALKEAVFRGKPNMNYLNAILRNWRNDGVTTVEQIEQKRKERVESQQIPKMEPSADFLAAIDLWKD